MISIFIGNPTKKPNKTAMSCKDTEIWLNRSPSHPCNALSQIRLTLPGIMSHPNSVADRQQKVSAGLSFVPTADSKTAECRTPQGIVTKKRLT